MCTEQCRRLHRCAGASPARYLCFIYSIFNSSFRMSPLLRQGAFLIQKRGAQKIPPCPRQNGGSEKQGMAAKNPHRLGRERSQFESNKKKILATQDICGICGRPVDKSIKYPHPLSPTVDHIIPIARGGSSDLENLQLAHRCCNRQKSDKLVESKSVEKVPEVISNRALPHTFDWHSV